MLNDLWFFIFTPYQFDKSTHKILFVSAKCRKDIHRFIANSVNDMEGETVKRFDDVVMMSVEQLKMSFNCVSFYISDVKY